MQVHYVSDKQQQEERKHKCATEGCKNYTWYDYCRECNFQYAQEQRAKSAEYHKEREQETAAREWRPCRQSGCKGKTQRTYCSECEDVFRTYTSRDCKKCGRRSCRCWQRHGQHSKAV